MFDKLWLSQKYCTISSITCAFRFIAILFDRIFPRVKPIGKFTEVVHGLVISHLVVAAGLFLFFHFSFLFLCLFVFTFSSSHRIRKGGKTTTFRVPDAKCIRNPCLPPLLAWYFLKLPSKFLSGQQRISIFCVRHKTPIDF